MDAFAALADPVRRSILREVATRPQRVVDLAARQPVSRPAVSKHLRLLAEAGLVRADEQGRERHYALVAEGLAPVADLLEGLLLAGTPVTPQALDALDTEVRRARRERRTPSSRREETA
jgi:DNA-binding transcriptional ArsR family regulator